MSISHHLDDATLMSCAAGTLATALAVVAMSHIALCPRCREGLAVAERIGGAALASLAPVPLAADAVTPLRNEPIPRDPPLPTRPSGEVPVPLAHLVGGDLDAIRWQPLGIGIWQHRVALRGPDSGELRLFKVLPGRGLPAHGHRGDELTLVLRGAYQDALGKFGAGDAADLDESVEHQPVADADAGCICVLACERPTRFNNPMVRLLQPLLGF